MAPTQFVPPNGLPLTTPVGTDGKTLGDLAAGGKPGKDGASVAAMQAEQGTVTPGQNSTATITAKLSDGTAVPGFELTVPAGAQGEKGPTGPAGDGWLAAGDHFQPVGVVTDVNLKTPMASMALSASATIAGATDNLIVVDPGQLGREFKGVGAALTESAASQLMRLTPAARTAFLTDVFGDKKWNHVRLCAGTSDYRNGPVYTYCDAGPVIDPNLTTFDLGRDKEAIIPIAQEILRINPSVQFFIAPWSPPAGVKDSGTIINGNINPTDANLKWLANYFVKTFWAFSDYGIRLSFVQPQNEPQVNASGYPCCGWTGDQLATFIGEYLGPAFATAGISMPITAVGGTNYQDEGGRRTTVLSDATAAKYATIGDTHAYGGAVQDVIQNLGLAFPTRDWIMSEFTLAKANSPWMNIAHMCDFFIGCARYGCSRVVMWNLMLDANGGPWQEGDNSAYNGTTTLNDDLSITYQADYWVMSQFMKYWQPGARLCASTCNSVGIENPYTVQTSAFLNPDGSRFLFAWNPTNDAKTTIVLDAVTGTAFPVTLDAGSIAALSWGAKNRVDTPAEFTAPGAPTLKTPTYTPFGEPYIAFDWPTATGSAPIAGYNLYDTANLDTPIQTISGTAIAFTDATLVSGQSRTYVARAINAAGEGAASNAVTATAIAVKAGSTHYAAIPASSANNLVSTVKNLDNSSGVLSGFIQFAPTSKILVPGLSSGVKLLFGDMDDPENSEKTFGLYIGTSNQVSLGVYDAGGTFSQVYGPCIPVANMQTAGLYLGFAVNTTASEITDYLGKTVPANSAKFYLSFDGGSTIYVLDTVTALSAKSIRSVATGGTETIACFCDGLGGYVYKAALYTGSAPTAPVLNPDFTAQATGATSFNDAAGNAWAVTAPAAVV